MSLQESANRKNADYETPNEDYEAELQAELPVFGEA